MLVLLLLFIALFIVFVFSLGKDTGKNTVHARRENLSNTSSMSTQNPPSWHSNLIQVGEFSEAN